MLQQKIIKAIIARGLLFLESTLTKRSVLYTNHALALKNIKP